MEETRLTYNCTEKYRFNGQVCFDVECPFCINRVRCFVWSMAASGKKCSCGAVLHYNGSARKRVKESKQ